MRGASRLSRRCGGGRLLVRTVYGEAGKPPPARKAFTVLDLAARKAAGHPIVMVTAYDAASAQHVEASGVDLALVGDSAGNVIQGRESTTAVTMDEMVLYCQQVTRQCRSTLVVGDMPFGSYTNELDAVRNAVRLVKEGGVGAVKLEGGKRVEKCVAAIRGAGIIVLGHLGVTPQTAAEQGGFRVQGKTLDSAMQLVEDALALEQAGVSALVLEMVSAGVASLLSQTLKVPTIGIGSGNACDGQVLVYHDMLSLLKGGHNPSFAKAYAHLFTIAVDAIKDFRREVETREFPSRKHSFLVPSSHVESVRAAMAARGIVVPAKQPSQPLPRRVCVVGGGAMGSLFSALLSRVAGTEVTMVSSYREHVEAINALGGIVMQERNATVTCPVKAQLEPSGPPADLVIILVKSYETPRASAVASKVVGPDTVVVSLQNGIGHSAVLHSVLGAAHTLLGVTSMAARVMQPGSVLSTGSGPTVLSPAGFTVSRDGGGGGGLDAFKGPCPKAALVRDLFVAADLDVRVAGSREQMEGAIYTKLMINSVINPLTALHSIPNGHLLLPAFSPVVAGLTAETYSVLNCCNKLTLQSPLDKVREVIQATTENESSMLFDVRRGVRTEVDVVNGTIVALAKSVGADAPLNRNMVRKVNGLLRTRPYSTAAAATANRNVVVCHTAADLLRYRASLDPNVKVGFVPTMGGIHAGHLELAKRARLENDVVVASVYVNPTQFAAHEDLARYPRDLAGDVQHFSAVPVDCVFAPSELYDRHHSTYVVPRDFASGEGKQRPTHFRGVATVVTKLFNLVRPTRAYFGQKDAQQCIVVRSLVRDLNMNLEIVVVETSRDPDGLALSTRNQYLNAEQRKQAPVLYAALRRAASAWVPGSSTAAALRDAFMQHVLHSGAGVEVQYFSVSSNETGIDFADNDVLSAPPLLLAAAISFPGFPIRLLDNIVVA